jgi:choline dehydrogenase
LRPESRGHIRIKSADPTVPPEIRVNYLSTETDQRANVASLRILRSIVHAPAMADYLLEEYEPGTGIAGDDELLAYCRERGSTIYHPVGTCTMGPHSGAVVSPDLKLHGAESIRVVDGSIMPRLISANTNASIIMIGEKAADMILADARRH